MKTYSMKTKIVYVLSSDEKDIYLEQTLLSVFSLRQYNKNAYVEIVVDVRTDKTIEGKRAEILNYFNKKTIVDVPLAYNKAETSRYLKTTLREYVTGDYLYIDSDTIITDSLSEIDGQKVNIGAVLDGHVLMLERKADLKSLLRRAKLFGWHYDDNTRYFNSGVFYVKDNEQTHLFYKAWHNEWIESLKKHNSLYDQFPLAKVNEDYGYFLNEINGIWNCQIILYGAHYLHKAKIIHYFASHGDYMPKRVYAFQDKNLFLKIKEKGQITEDIAVMVDNAKSLFIPPVRIVGGGELDILSGDLAALCLRMPVFLKIFNFVSLLFLIPGRFILRMTEAIHLRTK